MWNNNLNEALCFSNVSLCTDLQSQENEKRTSKEFKLVKVGIGQSTGPFLLF